MIDLIPHQQEMRNRGFSIIDDIYSTEEIKNILNCIRQADSDRPSFRKTGDLFAIRRFLQEVPAAVQPIFNPKLKEAIHQIFGQDFFVVKSIYFDKPGASNWFVSYHQDLMISVDRKIEMDGFGPWSARQGQYVVQPPLHLFEKNFTIRIHLDETDENNGALRVIPGSHNKGIYRPETIDWTKEKEVICTVAAGGIMLMHPLLLHASSRTTNNRQRRVIHIEFSNQQLPEPLQWTERRQ